MRLFEHGQKASRPAAVAGLFYPRAEDSLVAWIDDALAAAPVWRGEAPKALIVPHAGYVYSGTTAAAAYARLRPARASVARVVLLGPAHRVPVRGLALPDTTAFETPLGTVPVDPDAVEALAGIPGIVVSGAAHEQEHALEVQLPFLQRVLDRFTLVPLVVGAAQPGQVADVIERLWGGPETVVIVSSDLSHYHGYDEAKAIDGATVRSILALDRDLDHEQACGATPIQGLLEVARRRGLAAELVAACNSGDTAGDRSRVVGYASFAFGPAPAARGTGIDDRGRTLIALARRSIEEAFGDPPREVARAAWTHEPGATFVTLRQDGELRGCIGSLEPRRPLADDVAHNARAAAFADPRFAPLTEAEWPRTTVEVSLLSRPEPLAFADEAELYRRVRPGVDGIVLHHAGHRATFLPQVWESLPVPAQFFAQLKRKAGIAEDVPLTACTVERYTVEKWSEDEGDMG